jgi:hypothetical protein
MSSRCGDILGMTGAALSSEVAERGAEADDTRQLNDALDARAEAGENGALLKAITRGKVTCWVLPLGRGPMLAAPQP